MRIDPVAFYGGPRITPQASKRYLPRPDYPLISTACFRSEIMLGSKRPKFKFSFVLNDLSKIPHTSGYCYAEISIADGNPSGLRAAFAQLKPFSSLLKDTENDNVSMESKGNASTEHNVSSRSSRCIQVRTLKYRIHNFKSHFNFSMSCNLKFPLKRKDNMVGDKYLVLRVFYQAERSSKHDHSMELGVVRLNLAEYLNFNEPVTAKYLLQESKINSILNLTTSLEELPADFDFHTQLQIDESRHAQLHANSNLSISKASGSGTKSYNVPQFQRQAVFGGLDGVINPQGNKDAGLLGTPNESESASKHETNEDEKDQSHQQNTHMTTVGTKHIEDVIVDPIIGSLYRKILELTWDPDLHVLIKLTPQKVVDDIFELDKDPLKMENNLQFYRNLRPKPDADSLRNKEGLMVESKFRSNLTSWLVSWT